MSSAMDRKAVLRQVLAAVLREMVAIRRESVNWESLREQTLWYELVACLLGSGVRFEDAVCATRRLKRSGVLRSHDCGRSLPQFEKRVAEVLVAPCTRNDGCIGRYRFPRRRAELVRMAASAIYSSGRSLRALLKNAKDSRHAREVLVSTVPGIGPKQASLFLRNVGFADDLAILDVHVLRYLSWMSGATLGRRPNMSNLRRYERHEKRLSHYAREANVAVGDMDVAVWVTARVAVGEGMR
jgi:N-glycosylase/DNA lyase